MADFAERFLIRKGEKVDLSEISTEADPKAVREEVEGKLFPAVVTRISELQEKLWAENTQGLIVVLQGMDAAGKDSTVRKVFGEVDPAGLNIVSFKAPSAEEQDHDYLWRINKGLPSRGMIGIFNRSHYEDVVAARLHGLVQKGQLPEEVKRDKNVWDERLEQIRNWEKYLRQNGFRMVKVFLHVSKREQEKRLSDRLFNEAKHYKFSLSDLAERRYWNEYQELYARTIEETTTDVAPWYVVPADDKWYTRYAVAEIVRGALEEMDPKYPPLSPEVQAKLDELKQIFEMAERLKIVKPVKKGEGKKGDGKKAGKEGEND
ncbi:MAG: polyphosphate kinase 2 family protein [Sutterellaceae bacterium]|nr:polyphosphate kinase 2 family protein [Sutterellaceae bacterium]MDD7441192.1 polyphosphate kinase 2 family protein [Sutterellaceae bacterium]MDY2868832.1 PPK2 family polyphosphate kinase [Mesosutterella sp.]